MYRDSEIGVFFHHGVLARSAFPLRVAQAVNVLFALAYGALMARFLLVYVQARPSPVGQWIARVTDVVYLPIRTLIADGHDRAGHPVAWALLLAIGALALVQWAAIAWLRDVARPKLEEA